MDLFSDATPDQYVKAIDILRADPGNDGLLVIVTPQVMTDATGIAEGLRAFKKIAGKPMLASWMGGDDVAEGEAILTDSAISTFKCIALSSSVLPLLEFNHFSDRPFLPVSAGAASGPAGYVSCCIDTRRGTVSTGA